MKKNILLSLLLLLASFLFINNVNAITINESTDPSDGLTTIENNSIVIGVTRFEDGVVITAQRAATAGANDALFNHDLEGYSGVNIYYYLGGSWFVLDDENQANPLDESNPEDQETIEELESPEIYYVNNVEKQLTVDFTFDGEGDLVYNTDNNKDGLVTYSDGKLTIPATVKSLEIEIKDPDTEDVIGLVVLTKNPVNNTNYKTTSLTNYINALGRVVVADYTEASWATYQSVVLENVVTKNNTQEEVDTATSKITTAQGSLVFAGKADLEAAKGVAGGKTESAYTIATWSVLKTALALPETTNAEVVAKTAAITTAISNLVVKADLTAYNAALAAVVDADYTEASWATYQGVVSSNVVTVESTQGEVDTATSNITTAQGSLEFASLADLVSVKSIANGKTAADYTEATWSELQTALLLPETTNALIVTKITTINNTMSALVFAGLADLNTAKASAVALTETDYTTTSWTTLQTALLLPETTNEDVITKTNSINNAISGLVFAGLADLNTAKASAGALTETDYTTDSWKTLQTSLLLPETTNALIVTKITSINNSIINLESASFVHESSSGTKTYFESLSKALAKGSGTITMLKDVTIDKRITVQQNGMFAPPNNIILDLGGKTMTNTVADSTFRAILVSRGSNLTVKNGTINFTSGEGFYLNVGNLVLEEDVNINATNHTAIVLIKNSTLTTRANIKSGNDFAIAGNGTNGNGGTTVNVTGGTIASNVIAIYQPQSGTLNISGGTIAGSTAVYVKSGTTNISGGTLIGNGTQVAYTYNASGANSTGDALVIDNCGYPGGAPVVSITGGTVSSVNAKPVGSYANGELSPIEGFITGGTFSDLLNAVRYSANNSAIKLSQNVTLPETLSITDGKTRTIDLNGKTISSTITTTFSLTNGTLNVIDTASVKGGIVVSGEAFRVNGKTNTSATDAVLNIESGVNVTSSGDCAVFIYGKATLNTAGNLTSNWKYAPIQGNGSAVNNGTVINITGGSITSTFTDSDGGYHAIYVPQNGEMNISGGTITSAGTAIEAKGGTLTISGGTISTSATSTSHVPNPNGGSTRGYALAVVNNSGYSGAQVTVSGGSITGPIAILDDDSITENNNSTLEITGGEFSDIINAVKYSANNSAIKLSQNVTLLETLSITDGKTRTIDLNGKTISSTLGTTFSLTNGTLNVIDTASVKGGIVVSGEAFRVKGVGNTNATDAVLNIEAGVNVTSSKDCAVYILGKATLNTAGNLTSNWKYAPIQGNGSAVNNGTVINITGGSITSTFTDSDGGYHAIYVPQNGEMNISGGTITSAGTAIEAKAGTLTISGGTIITTATSTSHFPNPSGGSTRGYALAVVNNPGYENTSENPLTVTINGGTFNGNIEVLDDDDDNTNNYAVLNYK